MEGIRINTYYIESILILFLGIGGLLIIWGRPPEGKNRNTGIYLLKTAWGKCKIFLCKSSKCVARQVERRKKQRSGRLDQEIYDSSMVLKNLAIAEQDHAFSADYIYERLMENARRLAPVYGQMLSLYRSGKDQEAFAYFAQQCGSQAARNFSMILAKVDQINPSALVEQMEVFQEMAAQQKMTISMKTTQRSSLLVTAIATAAVFVGVINFAVVVVFMHALDTLGGMF